MYINRSRIEPKLNTTIDLTRSINGIIQFANIIWLIKCRIVVKQAFNLKVNILGLAQQNRHVAFISDIECCIYVYAK